MAGETLQFDEALHPGYLYTEPEGKGQVDFSQAPGSEDLIAEVTWHQDSLAYRIVSPASGEGWTKQTLLQAIAEGHADAIVKRAPVRFPPIPSGEWIGKHTAFLFDERSFGERLANRTLRAFGRQPRS